MTNNLPEDHVLVGGRITAGSQVSRNLTTSNASQTTKRLGPSQIKQTMGSTGMDLSCTTPGEESTGNIETVQVPKQAIDNPR